MPTACNYSWGDDIDAAIRDRANAYALPYDLAYSFIAAESAFDPYVSGDTIGASILGFNDSPAVGHLVTGPDGHRGMQFANGYIAWESFRNPGRFDWSHGLLQLQTGGGQGSVSPGVSRTWSELVNPWTNLDIGFPHIEAAFEACWTPTVDQLDYIYCIMASSGHPGPVGVNSATTSRVFGIWQCFYAALINGGLIPPAPVPPPNPTPPLPNPIPPLPNPGDTGSFSIDDITSVTIVAGIVLVGLMALKRPIVLKMTYPDGSMKKLIK